jgi:hypothetical protein
MKRLKVKQGPEAVLMSNRNRVHQDKKKKANKNKCRGKVDERD